MNKEINLQKHQTLTYIFKKKPDLIIDLISRFYPLNENQIKKFASLLNWEKIYKNENIIWTEELIKTYSPSLRNLLKEKIIFSEKLIFELRNQISWKQLYENNNLPWTENLINEFCGNFRFDWSALSENIKIDWNYELLAKYHDKWNWDKLFKNKSIDWNNNLLQKFSNKWSSCITRLEEIQLTSNFINENHLIIDFFELSRMKNVEWSKELIEKYKDKFDWSHLSGNRYLPWSLAFFKNFEDNWDYEHLSYNNKIVLNNELIEKYKEYWNWEYFSNNEVLPWSNEFIFKYEHKLNFESLSKNTSIHWTIELIEKYIDKWSWVNFSLNSNLPWNKLFLEKYFDKLNNFISNSLEFINWDYELLIKYYYHIDWNKLSKLRNVEWNLETLKMFSHSLNWYYLALNESVCWNSELIENFITEFDNQRDIRNSNMSYGKLWSYDLYAEKNTDWKGLCFNKNISISDKFIEEYKNKLYWDVLVNNTSLNFHKSFLIKFVDHLNESSLIWEVLKNEFDDHVVEKFIEKFNKSKIKIANKLTINDWEILSKKLNPNKKRYWNNAYCFFETRINTRYINPIIAINDIKENNGEGFAIVNLQCSLIEMIECFINGWINEGNKWKKNNIAIKNSDIGLLEKVNDTIKNVGVFISFFKYRTVFQKYNIEGDKFFWNVRCALLHETQTKNNWKIKKGLRYGVAYEEKDGFKILYRDNFQRDLENLIQEYKYSIINGVEFDGISASELRENFIAKFNHICHES